MVTRLHAATKHLFVDSNIFRIYDPDVMQHPDDDGDFDASATGLVTVTPSGPLIVCGTHLGRVLITAELWDSPPDLDTASWQDVAELTALWEGSEMEVWGETEEIPLPISGPGAYRLRVHARHRDDGEDRDESDPMEEILIQVWPTSTPDASTITHKTTSTVGAMWHEP